jgi:hypothetical protein
MDDWGKTTTLSGKRPILFTADVLWMKNEGKEEEEQNRVLE